MKKYQKFILLFMVGIAFISFQATLGNNYQYARASGTVGTGTPASCTEAAFNTALSGGGTITFNCGAAPHTIILSSVKSIATDTEIQGGDLITISGGNATPLFAVSAHLILRDITLTRGYGPYGTIRNVGTVDLINSQITYSNASENGGAIDNAQS